MEHKEALSYLSGCICKMANSRDVQRRDNPAIMCVSLKYKNVRYDIYFHFRHQKLYCIRGNCPFVNYIYIFSYFRS